jgi:4-carboxymuconolactone decarboxylase
LIGGGKAAQLTSHFNHGLDNGLTADQLSALITNAAFHSGWPNAVSAIAVAQEVFKNRGVSITAGDAAVDASAIAPDEDGTPLANYASIIEALWKRNDLSQRDRALATLAVMVAGGDVRSLPRVLERGRMAGLTRAQVEEALLHLAFYAGRPKAEAAAPYAAAAYGTASPAPGMILLPKGAGEGPVPTSNFTGNVRLSTSFTGSGGARIGGATVSFEAGARTNWHRHPLGQALAITQGCGWTQVEGGPVRRICAGDLVWVEPGAKHWHGATRSEGMTHVAVSERADGMAVTWLEPVSGAQYAGPGS